MATKEEIDYKKIYNKVIKIIISPACIQEIKEYLAIVTAQIAYEEVLFYQPTGIYSDSETKRRPLDKGLGAAENLDISVKIENNFFSYTVVDNTPPNKSINSNWLANNNWDILSNFNLANWISGTVTGTLENPEPVIPNITKASNQFWAKPYCRPYLQILYKTLLSSKCWNNIEGIIVKHTFQNAKAIIDCAKNN